MKLAAASRCASLVAIGALLAFVARELTAPAPVVNLRPFRDGVFTSGTLIGGLTFAMLMANMFLLPLFDHVSPVRIELVNPPSDLPLRAGLSADVTVYLR